MEKKNFFKEYDLIIKNHIERMMWCKLSETGDKLILYAFLYNEDGYYNYNYLSLIEDVNKILGLNVSLYKKISRSEYGDKMGMETENGLIITWKFNSVKGLEIIYSL